MKKDIHPDYVDCTVTCTCGNTFQTRSTKPELRVDICNACHPFFTGTQKLIDTGGRVQRFADKFGSAADMVAKAEAEKKAAAPAEENGVDFTHEEEIDFDTFCKVELRVAEVRACENLKESKKLLHLTVFDGERERCILSGIAKWFAPEDLIGKKIGIVANLAPRPMMKGKYVSEGMIFAADTADGGCSIAFYGDDTPVGSRIH